MISPPAHIAQLVRALDLKTRGCGFKSRAGQPNSYLLCYTPSMFKNQAEFLLVLSCNLALSPVTTNSLLGASLRWETGRDDD